MVPFLVILLTVSIVVFAIGWLRWKINDPQKNADETLCEVCAYDLRASRDRCPECGTLFHSPEDFFPLRDEWPLQPISPRVPELGELRQILYESANSARAELLVHQLNDRGIAAASRRIRRVTQVVVYDNDLAVARAITHRLMPDEFKPNQSHGDLTDYSPA